ncbi:DUF2778 domain-containing protein [Paramixta manurensis]|uniref:DUF2778 domain-containing protein n=1 Tax=Paramixta manurensis TaxID=2740817 RepID=A0A6M8UQF6_9GAMM|nr:DUF2778 domain-containing protein [Erwiniaceae bacterium PD-1]
MQIMRMSYDDLTKGGGEAKLHVYGVGTFPVFSGEKPYTNDPNCAYIKNSAIPVGRYWIVDRPEGSFANQARAAVWDRISGNRHDEWFGLFSDATMSDSVFINGVSRGSFRLHPLRPNGAGISQGCITFFRPTDFQFVRRSLLARKKKIIQRRNLQLAVYGWVDVMGNSDFENCKIR